MTVRQTFKTAPPRLEPRRGGHAICRKIHLVESFGYILILVEKAIEQRCRSAAEQRSDDKYPYLRNGGKVAAYHLQERGTYRTGGATCQYVKV